MTIAVVSYRAGNLASVLKALSAAGATPCVVTVAAAISGAGAIVVPGVGHFAATAAIDDALRRAIRQAVDAGVPLLGICLGMQWLFEGSDEAPDVPGLGLLAGRSRRLVGPVKIPHVGWNSLEPTGAASRLLADAPGGASAYFTHSYAVPVGDSTVAVTTHGMTFASVVERGHIFGAQCHPEKSGVPGLRMLAAFVAAAQRAGARC